MILTAATVGYVPDFRLRINERETPTALRSSVLGIRYENGHDAASRVEVQLANPDLTWLRQHVRGLGVAPLPTGIRVGPLPLVGATTGLLDIDNPLSLSLGYTGQLTDVFDGNVTGLSASFPADGAPSLVLVAHDRLQRLTRGTATRSFGLLPDFLVAALLGAENLLLPVIDPAVATASSVLAVLGSVFGSAGRTQAEQSDLGVLAEIAARYDAHFWVDGSELHLSRIPTELSPSVELAWGRSLIDFSPRMTNVGQVAAVAARLSIREIPLDFVVTVAWDFDLEALTVTVVPGAVLPAGQSGPAVTVLDRLLSGPADLETTALAILRELRTRLNSRVTAAGSCLGDPRIRAGSLVRVSGVGPDFSGDYRVSEATHTIDARGYRTAFSSYREILP